MGVLNAADITAEDVLRVPGVEIMNGDERYIVAVDARYHWEDGLLFLDDEEVRLWCSAEQRRVNVLEGEERRQARINERCFEIGFRLIHQSVMVELLASPDICHRVVPITLPSPKVLGFALVCTPSLPPNTIAAPDVVRAGG